MTQTKSQNSQCTDQGTKTRTQLILGARLQGALYSSLCGAGPFKLLRHHQNDIFLLFIVN